MSATTAPRMAAGQEPRSSQSARKAAPQSKSRGWSARNSSARQPSGPPALRGLMRAAMRASS
eukprot:168924-Lingulodinium_polyedra.AAC.1